MFFCISGHKNCIGHTIIIISLLLVFFSCKSHKDSDIAFETKVLDEIFVELIREINVNYGLPIAPPPPAPVYDKDGKISGYDSLTYMLNLRNWENDVKQFQIEPKSVPLIVGDSLFQIQNEEIPNKHNIPSKKYGTIYNNMVVNRKESKKLDLSKLKNTGYFYLIDSSKYRKNSTEKNHIDKEIQSIGFSRIYFDPDETCGIFSISYYWGPYLGHGNIVFLNNKNGKWEIEKISQRWII